MYFPFEGLLYQPIYFPAIRFPGLDNEIDTKSISDGFSPGIGSHTIIRELVQ
jgi:hypothetical protein